MKTSHFEERIALRAVQTAQRRDVSLQHSIMTLAAHGWSRRRNARELDIHRETVGRHLRLAGSKPAKVLTGSEPDSAAKPAIPLTGSEPVLELKPAIPLTGSLSAGRQSLCVPLQAVIEAAVQAGLSAQLDFLETHPLIRNLDTYRDCVPDCFATSTPPLNQT